MDELLIKDTFQKLYGEYKFMKESGLYNLEINKLVAEEFYRTGYNKAINDLVDKLMEEQIFSCMLPDGFRADIVTSYTIDTISEQLKLK